MLLHHICWFYSPYILEKGILKMEWNGGECSPLNHIHRFPEFFALFERCREKR